MPQHSEIIPEPIGVPNSVEGTQLLLPAAGVTLLGEGGILLLKIFPWFPIVYNVPSPQPGIQYPHSQLSVPVGTKAPPRKAGGLGEVHGAEA